MRIGEGLKVVKVLMELNDDEKNNPSPLGKEHIKLNLDAARVIEPNYVSIPYVFRRDVFEKIFVEQLKLEECKKALDRF